MRVVWDGCCGICERFRRVVSWFDRRDRLDWIDLHNADYAELPITQGEAVEAMHVVDGEEVFRGFYATRRIFRAIPWFWPLWLFMHIPGVPFVGERVYRWVASHRACVIQDT